MLEVNPAEQKSRLDWDSIDTVFLDMDGTLLDLNYDNQVWSHIVPAALAEARQIPIDQARQFLGKHMSSLLGTMPFYSFSYWSEFTGLDIMQLHQTATAHIDYLPGAKDFLTDLKNSNKQTFIATNADRKGFNLKHQCTGLGDYVDGVVSSHDFAVPKEQQEFWRALQQQHPFDPARTLFLDDTPRVLDAAATFGIRENWAILNPDSQKPLREKTLHPAVNNCAELLPGLL
ncbi:MAG: HAD superfamily hydrolase (TIGR01509 family) [Candidatus Azotimanducaceae bacterium]|jgi:HAD superfamily hydrolase (TIGR01509 family)|tara:strand:+ start:7961 stop:8653 length:693 start_codon:yes stop_codon:yes gene_type:complete